MTEQRVAQHLEYQALQKEVTGFYRPMLHHADANGRVHSGFNSARTVTGRLSSSGPNLQNIAKKPEIRACFRAAPGKELWEYDLAAAELRVIASLAKEARMIEMLLAGEDLHGATAASVFGPDYTDAERGLGKNMNFTLPYFGGWEPIARYMAKGLGTNITPKIEYEAKRAHDNWHKTWTRIHHLMYYLDENGTPIAEAATLADVTEAAAAWYAQA